MSIRRHAINLVIALCSVRPAAAQVDTLWVRTYTPSRGVIVPWGIAMAADSSGDVYITATLGPSLPYDTRIATVKYTPSGEHAWERIYGRIQTWYTVMASSVAPDGSVYITGSRGGECLTLRYSPSGQLLDELIYDSSRLEDEGTRIACDPAGNVHVGGWSGIAGFCFTDSADMMVLKYNSGGDLLWAHRYAGPEGVADRTEDLHLDDAGNVYLAGRSYARREPYCTGRFYAYDVLKYTPEGVLLWAYRYVYSDDSTMWCGLPHLAIDQGGHVYLAGSCGISASKQDLVLLKIGPQGQLAWERQFSREEQIDCAGLGIDGLGNVIIAGTGSHPIKRVEANPVVWTAVKYTSDGAIVWQQEFAGTCEELGRLADVSIDENNHVWLIGHGVCGGAVSPTIVELDTDGRAATSSTGPPLPIDGVIDAEWRMGDELYVLGFPPVLIKYIPADHVETDLLPRQCPNRIGMSNDLTIPGLRPSPAAAVPRKPEVPLAILGGPDFDVTDIEYSSALLEGIAPTRSVLADVTGPLPARESGDCECMALPPDGYTDLVLYFNQDALLSSQEPWNAGEMRKLKLTARQKDRTPLIGTDCALLDSGITRLYARDDGGSTASERLTSSPNPFNASTTIGFSLPSEAHVRLDVFDILGRHVATLLDDLRPAGSHAIVWQGVGDDGGAVASGIYFCRMTASGFSATRKLLLLR